MPQKNDTKNNRATVLARIHIAKKELALDEETYRAMLVAAVGKDSCANMHISELYKVIEHLKQRGYKPTARKYGKRPNPAKPNKALMGKVEALLADNGLHWNYAHSMAKHMFNVEKVDWLSADQLWRVVAALEKQARRQKKEPVQ